MTEQTNQNVESNSQEVQDDPLAELARIVAGEPELQSGSELTEQVESKPEYESRPESMPEASSKIVPEDEKVSEPISEPAIEVEPEVEMQLVDSASMEAALEEQLMQEFSVDEAGKLDIETPEFVDDINSSVDEISQTAAQETAVEPTIQAIAEPEFQNLSATEEQNSEMDFQDDLITALEGELVNEAPEAETANKVSNEALEATTEEVDLVTEQTFSTSMVNDAFVDIENQSANVQQTLEEELSNQLADNADSVTDIIETAELTPADPIASIEDDLGDAFKSKFEQMNLGSDEPAAAVEPIAESIASEASGDPDMEMDFEAAFADELGVAEIPETTGWTETTTSEANAAFMNSANPDAVTANDDSFDPAYAGLDSDPGHVGSIDDISEVANDNGGGKKYAIAALIIALFAGAIAAGYGFLGGKDSLIASGTPEVIIAGNDPVKVKPKDPGGLVPENQDNASYTDLGGENKVEVSQKELVSKTEEPATLNNQVAGVAPKSDDRLSSSQDTGATPTTNNSSVLPKVVQTVVVKPDGTIITKPAALTPVQTATNTTTIGNASAVTVQPVETQEIKKPEAIDGAISTGDLKIPTASPLPKPIVKPKPAPVKKVAAVQPKPAPAPAPAAPAARKSEWVVQVSSQRSPEAAQSSFVDMRNRFSALRGRAMSIQRANVNGSTYYRVRVQTASRSDANQLCSRLASAGGNCFVTR